MVAPALPTWRYQALRRLDRLIGWVSEGLAAVLVAAEIVILFSGVVARYVFDSPLTWSDELASLCFLWLGLLGACVALRRGEHMRMTAMVTALPPRGRAFVEVLAIAASAAFLLLIVMPAYKFALNETFITTPALGISAAWRASALPVCAALMILIALVRLGRVASARQIVEAVAYAIDRGDSKQQQFQQILRNLGFEVRLTVLTDSGEVVTVELTRTHARRLGVEEGSTVFLSAVVGAAAV